MTPTSNVPAGAPLEAAGERGDVAGQRPWYARIGVALLTTALALVLTALLLPYLHRSIFLFLFVAVGVSAWYGGLRAGILAALAGLLAINYLFLEPRGTLLLGERDLVPFALFALAAALLSTLSESLRSARAKAEKRHREAALMAVQLEEQARALERQVSESRALNAELEARAETARRLSDALAEANRLLEQRSREQLAEAQRLAHLGSWAWRADGGEVSWSDEMYRVYGLEPGSGPITFEQFLAMVHPEDRDAVRRTVRESLAHGESFVMEHRIVRPDGAVRLLEGRGKVLTDGEGRPIGMVGTGQDVTDQRMVEAAARRALQAEAANEAKMQFLATMSHELRTPLNAIGGYAELLSLGVHGRLTEQQQEILARIRRAGTHLLGLINDILNYVKLDAGQVSITLSRVALADVLSEVGPLIRPQLHAKQLAYELSPPADDLFVRADREKMVQVLLNLLSNAVKFTPAGGRVAVKARANGDRVAIEVSDTGIGIPDDKLEVIFDPFVQVSGSFTRTAEGAGLGLAISRALARAMGGEIGVESEVGKGSTFRFVLPKA